MRFILRRLTADPQQRIGMMGERRAVGWLRSRGYSIINRRLRIGWDEADIVAIDPSGTLVIVEVKTSTNSMVQPELMVGSQKRHRLTRLAGRLTRHKRYAGKRWRFDVIAVNLARKGDDAVMHYPNAFESRL